MAFSLLTKLYTTLTIHARNRKKHKTVIHITVYFITKSRNNATKVVILILQINLF